RTEEQTPNFAPAYHAIQLFESEKRNKGEKDDEDRGKILVFVCAGKLLKSSCPALMTNQSLDRLFHKRECRHKDCEDNRPGESRKNKRPVVHAPPKAEKIAYENHFGENQGFDQGDAIVQITDFVVGQDQSSIGIKYTKEKG